VEPTARLAPNHTRPVLWLTSRLPARSPGEKINAGERPSGHRDWRSATTRLLAVAAIVCLFLGNVALWMRQDVYSARNVEQEAQRIVGSPNVQGAVADLLTTKVVQPALAQTEAGPLMVLVKAPLRSLSDRLIEQVVATQPAQHVAARLVEQVVPELDKGAGPISLSPRQLMWIASPSLASNHAVASVLNSAERSGCCQVVLAQRQTLSFGWRHVGMIRVAGVVLPALFVACVGLALGLSRRRRRLAVILAGATVLTGLVTFASLLAGPGFWDGIMVRPGSTAGVLRAVDSSVFNGATSALRTDSLVVAILGLGALAGLAAAHRIRTSSFITGSDGPRMPRYESS
jgi:hypothetical protein